MFAILICLEEKGSVIVMVRRKIAKVLHSDGVVGPGVFFRYFYLGEAFLFFVVR